MPAEGSLKELTNLCWLIRRWLGAEAPAITGQAGSPPCLSSASFRSTFTATLTLLLAFVSHASSADESVFARDVAPVLVRKCLTCHNDEKAKGGYRLHDTKVLLKAGDSGEAPVTAGKPEASHLFALLVHPDADERMPQKDEPLPKSDIEAIRRWITSGAALPEQPVRLTVLVPRVHSAPPAVYLRPVPVNAMALAVDGRMAFGGINEVFIRDAATASLQSRITNLPPQIHGLDFSPDGSWLAVGGGLSGQFGEAVVVKPAEPASRRIISSLKDLVLEVRFSPDGQLLAVAGADNAVRLFSTSDWKEALVLQHHADWVVSTAFSADGKHLVTASRDKTVRVCNVTNGQVEATYIAHAAPVFAAVFSADGKLVLSGGRDRAVHGWRVSDGKEQFRLKEFEGDIQRLVVRSNDLFAASSDKLVRQYRIDTKALVRTFEGHRDWVQSLVLPREAGVLYSGAFDGEVRVWKTATGEFDHRFAPAP